VDVHTLRVVADDLTGACDIAAALLPWDDGVLVEAYDTGAAAPASGGTAASPRGSKLLAKELLEEIAEPAENIIQVLGVPTECDGPAFGRLVGAAPTESLLPVHPTALVGLEHLVKFGSLVGLAQHLIRFVDLFEAILGPLALIDIRMELPREAPVGLADHLLISRPLDA